MTLVKWDESFSVGIEEIDRQHQELLGLINALHEYRERDNHEFIDNILATLREYVKKHFQVEEKLMRSIEYPDLEKHRAQHRAFVKQIEKYQREFEDDKRELSDKVLDYLKMWLSTHILVHDKAYQRFIREHHIHTT